jgi:hypothetical protein
VTKKLRGGPGGRMVQYRPVKAALHVHIKFFKAISLRIVLISFAGGQGKLIQDLLPSRFER